MQHKYRREASSFYFWMEFILTLLISLLYQSINISFVRDNFSYTFSLGWIYFALYLSGTIILGGIFRLIYNSLSKFQIEWDLWTTFDFFVAILNVIDVYIILATVSPALIGYSDKNLGDLISSYSRSLKYLISMILILNWIRSVLFFLCFRMSATLIVTLVYMIYETFYFLIIFLCYLLIMTTVFYMIFGGVNYNDLKNIGLALNWIYDATMGSISHPSDLGIYDLVHRFFLALHVLASNLILLNYLVAILSTVYNLLNQEENKRLFACRSFIYYYSKRLSNAMIDMKYGDYILIMPPFNPLLLFSLVFVFKDNAHVWIMNKIRFIYFLIVSLISAFFLMIYYILISPVMYVKLLFNSLLTNNSAFNKIIVIVIWFFLGPLIMIVLIIIDLKNYAKVLANNYSFDDKKVDQKENENKFIHQEVFNEMKILINSLIEVVEQKFDINNRCLITKRALNEIINKMEIERKIDTKVIQKGLHHENLTKKNFDYNSRLNSVIQKNIKLKELKLHHFNNEKNILIDLKNKSITMPERKSKVGVVLDIFVNCFVFDEFFGTVLDIKLMNAIIGKNFKQSNIEKIFMINYTIINQARKEIRNKDNYGISEYFDNVNHSRYTKLKKKVDYLTKMVEKIDDVFIGDNENESEKIISSGYDSNENESIDDDDDE
jgi:hypothetical protein